jgi:hypothetical protein
MNDSTDHTNCHKEGCQEDHLEVEYLEVVEEEEPPQDCHQEHQWVNRAVMEELIHLQETCQPYLWETGPKEKSS